MISWGRELDFLKQEEMKSNGGWLEKRTWMCSSFSLAGWGLEHVTYRSILYSSGCAACRQAPMHSSCSSSSLSELPVITIGTDCYIINALEWTDCSWDCCPVVEGCCHVLHGLERLHFKTMFNRVNNNNNTKEVIRITVLEICRSKAF